MDTTQYLFRTLMYISLFMMLSTVSFILLCAGTFGSDFGLKDELRYRLQEAKRKMEEMLDVVTKPCRA